MIVVALAQAAKKKLWVLDFFLVLYNAAVTSKVLVQFRNDFKRRIAVRAVASCFTKSRQPCCLWKSSFTEFMSSGFSQLFSASHYAVVTQHKQEKTGD